MHAMLSLKNWNILSEDLLQSHHVVTFLCKDHELKNIAYSLKFRICMRRFVGRANFLIETQNKLVHTLEMLINHMEELARLLMGSISMFRMSN